MRTGTLRVITIAGMPIGVHYTALVTPLLAATFHFTEGAILGTFLVLAVNGVGQACVAFGRRARPRALLVHGLGARCRLPDDASAKDAALVAWGGLVADVLLVCVVALLARGEHASSFASAVVRVGAGLALVGLLPFPPLAGADAWRPLARRLRGRPAPVVADADAVVRDALARARREALGRPEPE